MKSLLERDKEKANGKRPVAAKNGWSVIQRDVAQSTDTYAVEN